MKSTSQLDLFARPIVPPRIVPRDLAAEQPSGPFDDTLQGQVERLQREARDALLMVRMGDFFEFFGADAEAVGEALDIAVTKRSWQRGGSVAMCGVPVHSAESYLAQLVAKGYAVAVADQVETLQAARKLRGPGAVVKRAVCRMIWPGPVA